MTIPKALPTANPFGCGCGVGVEALIRGELAGGRFNGPGAGFGSQGISPTWRALNFACH